MTKRPPLPCRVRAPGEQVHTGQAKLADQNCVVLEQLDARIAQLKSSAAAAALAAATPDTAVEAAG